VALPIVIFLAAFVLYLIWNKKIIKNKSNFKKTGVLYALSTSKGIEFLFCGNENQDQTHGYGEPLAIYKKSSLSVRIY
jgi:nucleoside permease NupC